MQLQTKSVAKQYHVNFQPPADTSERDAALLGRDTLGKAPARRTATAPGVAQALAQRVTRSSLRKAGQALEPLRPWMGLAAAAGLLATAKAYTCTGYGTATQAFSNANQTVVGQLYGKWADCYDVCYQCLCSSSCSSTGSCTTSCQTCCDTYTDKVASDYVKEATSLIVSSCGAQVATNITATLQHLPSYMEAAYRVMASVNVFNVSGLEDPMVTCIGNLGA